MKKISLIGAGWLGRPLALHWLKSGHRVRATTTSKDKKQHLEKEGVQAERWTLQSPAPAWVVDSDALVFTAPPRPDPEIFQEQAIRFFYQIKEKGFNGRVLFCSSISVLGNETGLKTEQDKTFPQTASATSLYEIEKELKALGFPSTAICRLGGLYGEKRHPARTLAKKGKALTGGQKPVNLLHLQEAICLFDRLLEANLSSFETFHAVNEIQASKSEFYPLCAQIMQLSPIEYQNSGKSQLAQGKRVSNAKIKDQLNMSFSFCPLI